MSSWWKERVVYQIYPRSFQDSNGDGIGDIPGIISRLDELRELGIGIIWLSPVYKSPDIDNGYDISDYRDINPKFGTMADMEELFAEAEKRDIKIIMDLIINHTSDEHDWFKKSRDKDSPYRDYYIWKPADPDGKPPNNWTSFFVDNAWEFDPKSGEYYLHLFHEKQPDLNYRNPKVIEEVKEIMHFWMKKGAAGFRCDVINIIYKTSFDDGIHRLAVRGREHFVSQEGAHKILQELRRDVLDHYDCFTVGESAFVNLRDARLLSDPERKELDMVFYFDHLQVDRIIENYIPKRFKANKLLDILTKWQQGLDWNAVYLENHDQPRIVSHYGDDKQYRERSAKLLATMLLTLKGTPFIYQGQEIGMTNFDFNNIKQVNDVATLGIDRLLRSYRIPASLRWKLIKSSSRDNARTPMQWSAKPGAGFTTGKPWLGINSNYTEINYQEQKERTGSVYSFYKNMILLRASSKTLKYGDFTPVYSSKKVIAYTRTIQGDEQYAIILNFSNKPATAPFEDSLIGKVIVTNIGRSDYDGTLSPWEAVVLKVW
ncbi:MAG: alpha-glucosidase [Oscillospiraceae bacterium]|jgi:oligo-1,6-glucosidase|nr:alpha-glucosidase [Oscillospiraceae bacterium]